MLRLLYAVSIFLLFMQFNWSWSIMVVDTVTCYYVYLIPEKMSSKIVPDFILPRRSRKAVGLEMSCEDLWQSLCANLKVYRSNWWRCQHLANVLQKQTLFRTCLLMIIQSLSHHHVTPGVFPRGRQLYTDFS